MNRQTRLCSKAMAWFIQSTNSALKDDAIDAVAKVKEITSKIDTVNKFLKENVDFTSLTEDQASILGMEKWEDAKDGKVLYLFPGWAYTLLCQLEDVVVTTVNGESITIKEDTYIDNDTRFGMLAYGVYVEVQ